MTHTHTHTHTHARTHTRANTQIKHLTNQNYIINSQLVANKYLNDVIKRLSTYSFSLSFCRCARAHSNHARNQFEYMLCVCVSLKIPKVFPVLPCEILPVCFLKHVSLPVLSTVFMKLPSSLISYFLAIFL